MTEFAKYLDGLKAKLGLKSDNQLSIKLGCSQSAVQSWMSSGRVPEDDVCIRIAKLAGDDPAKVILLAHRVKASDAARPYWDKIFKSCAAAAFCVTILATFPPPVEASTFDLTQCILCQIALLLFIYGRRYFVRVPAPAFASILLVFILASTSFAGELVTEPTLTIDNNNWTLTDTIGQALVTAALIGDWGQTSYGTRHPERFEETNPILGKHPHRDKVHAYFVACIVGHAMVSYLLPRNVEIWGLSVPARTIWQYVWIGIEADVIRQNYTAGVQWRL